jgi:hypothetical protein
MRNSTRIRVVDLVSQLDELEHEQRMYSIAARFSALRGSCLDVDSYIVTLHSCVSPFADMYSTVHVRGSCTPCLQPHAPDLPANDLWPITKSCSVCVRRELGIVTAGNAAPRGRDGGCCWWRQDRLDMDGAI